MTSMPFEHEEDSGLKHETRLNYPTRIDEMEYGISQQCGPAWGLKRGGDDINGFFFFKRNVQYT